MHQNMRKYLTQLKIKIKNIGGGIAKSNASLYCNIYYFCAIMDKENKINGVVYEKQIKEMY